MVETILVVVGLTFVSSARCEEIILFETGFEASEGFLLGSLHEQNGWTGDSEHPEDSTVTDEIAHSGAQAAYVAGQPYHPVFGLGVTSPPLANTGPERRLSLSYEAAIRIDATGGPDYAVQTIDSVGQVAGTVVLFTFTGDVYVDFFDSGLDWTPGQWMELRIEVDLDHLGCPNAARVWIDGQQVAEHTQLAGVNVIDALQFVADREPVDSIRMGVDDVRVTLRYTYGDFTGDGLINLDDFATFARCFANDETIPPFSCLPDEFEFCDLDGDGAVGLYDFATFASRFTR
jgi:hypothetical protein